MWNPFPLRPTVQGTFSMQSLDQDASAGSPSHRSVGESHSSAHTDQIRYEVVGSVGEGLNLRLRDNLLQGIAILGCAAAGAVIGYNALTGSPWLGVVYGAVIGMIGGAFVSGLLLLCLARRRNLVTLREFLELQSRAKRRLSFAITAFIAVVVAFPLIMMVFGHDDSPWAFILCVLWLMLLVGLCAYAKGTAASGQLQLRCPKCGSSVPVSCDPASRRCNQCDFGFS